MIGLFKRNLETGNDADDGDSAPPPRGALRPEWGTSPGSDYRHEVKYEISPHDLASVRARLESFMTLDSHAAPAGKYRVHSLYFDTLDDDALWEKENGVDPRYKFRIRCYDNFTSGEYKHLHLEKKMKRNGLGKKLSAPLPMQWKDVEAILEGEWDFQKPDATLTETELLEDFRRRIVNRLLVPKVIVDYVREPYALSLGDVRVTLDYNLRRGLSCDLFREYDCATMPILDAPIIMEVKWNDALPERGVRFLPPSIVRNIIRVSGGRPAVDFSKYALCRRYG